MNVSIVGGGIVGLSIARSLLKLGYHVRLFEKDRIPNPLSSSYDDHRLIRYPYGSSRGYMRMVSDAYLAWNRLWEDLDEHLYYETGTLVLSKDSSKCWASDSLTELEKDRVELSTLSNEQLRTQYPHISSEEISLSYYLPSGGVLFADKILGSLKSYLLNQSIQLFEGTHITNLNTETGDCTTSRGELYNSDVTVVTAGPWLSDLVPTSEYPVIASRQSLIYLDTPESDQKLWAHTPMILDIDPQAGFYFVPPVEDTSFKIGDHSFSLQGHPNDDRKVLENDYSHLLEMIKRRFPRAHTYKVKEAKACYYTVATNEQFIAHQLGNAWILTGFSGHGFKFAPLVGERFAGMLSKQESAQQFSEWLSGRNPN